MIGLSHSVDALVTREMTAAALGSGDLDVLATPAMIALMENAAMLAVAPHLPEGATTVGGSISCTHLRPTAIGKSVTATAKVIAVDGKKITFAVIAREGEHLVGEGTHTRFIVDRKQFTDRLNASANG